MEIQLEVLHALDDALGLEGRAKGFCASTLLFGSLPELDSMAVVDLIVALEERFGFSIEDDEITAQIFSSVGSLTDFVGLKLKA